MFLRQRPGVSSIRSTFGTGTELLNHMRLMFLRLASHRCPNGHYVAPSKDAAAGLELCCPDCGVHFMPPGADRVLFVTDCPWSDIEADKNTFLSCGMDKEMQDKILYKNTIKLLNL